jgi:pimeloyl-ACP methyl ester carboxylesterase
MKRIYHNIFIVFIGMLVLSSCNCDVTPKRRIVESFDETPISYEVYGKGDATLIFVHGWSCDSRYWNEQVNHFAQKYRVITVDLAGHGHSGSGRTDYALTSFAKDIQAVVEHEGSKKNILIGHSMGGEVILETALLLHNSVAAIVGVDTLHDIESQFSTDQIEEILKPLESNFRVGTQEFVRGMVREDISTAALNDWIAADMSSANPHVALSAIKQYLKYFVDGRLTKIAEEIKVPVHVINSNFYPTDLEGNKRHFSSFHAIIIPDTDHFLMLKKSSLFNDALDEIIQQTF